MLRHALPALLAVCLLPLACTVSTGTKADADQPKPNTDAGSSVSPDSSDTDPPEPEQDDQVRVSPTPVELADCPAEQGDAIANYCTEDGKLAGSWVLVDSLEVPDDVTIIFNADGPDQSKQTSLLIATRGEALYIRHVTCGSCRRVLGQGFSGHPANMSEDQVRELQTQLGLSADTPLLDSTEKWTSFCGDERGKAALTKIASKAEGDGGGRGR